MRSSFALCLVIAALLLARSALAQNEMNGEAERAYYVLTRLGYGPAGNDVARVAQMGVDNYLREQLHPESIPLPDSLQQQLAQMPTLDESLVQLFLNDRQLTKERKEDKQSGEGDRKAIGASLAEPAREARDARLLMAIESPRQLNEVLVDFWYNHFNVYAKKELDRVFVGAYERDAIRPYVLGRFRDMLEATAKHPAMLYYLDNWKNVAPSSKPSLPDKNGKVKEEGINENYAREVMELHTLGVDGGYSQTDVTELARILSGWGLGARNLRPRNQFGGQLAGAERQDQVDGQTHAGFFFNPDHHDYGEKHFLGRDFHGSGQDEGEQALDMLAYSPVTARHVSYELAQYFVADKPPQSLVDTMSATWMRTNGDLREVTATMIAAPEFWDAQYRGDKYRTPLQYVVASVRASGAPVDVEVLDKSLEKMGEQVYGNLTPDGYKNTIDAWLNTAGTEARLTFATAIGSGKLEKIHVERDDSGMPGKSEDDGPPVPLDPKVIEATLDNFFSAQTLAAVNAADRKLQAALLLGSPEMMRR